jgi:hypothetical protein
MVCDTARSAAAGYGPSAQAICGWRGAHDVITGFDGHALSLSQCFRLGPGSLTRPTAGWPSPPPPVRLTGTDAIPTELSPVDRPDAVLCRTNTGAMTWASARARSRE